MPHWFDSANELCYYGKSSTLRFSLCTTKTFISDTQTMANSSIFLDRQLFKVRIPCYRILRIVHLQFRACHNSYYRPPGPVLKSTIWYYIPCVPKCQRRRCPHITNQTWTIVRQKTSIVLKQNWISSIRNYQEFWRNANVCWYISAMLIKWYYAATT